MNYFSIFVGAKKKSPKSVPLFLLLSEDGFKGYENETVHAWSILLSPPFIQIPEVLLILSGIQHPENNKQEKLRFSPLHS